MFNTLKAAAAAGALALTPMAASAVTLDPANNIEDGGTYEITNDPYFFDISFDDGDNGNTKTFNFVNMQASTQIVAVTMATILQSTAKFMGGVTLAWANGSSVFVPEGQTSTADLSTVIPVGGEDTLTLTYGKVADVRDGKPGRADIDLTVTGETPAAVPLPAGGLLLLTALGGGAAAVRRRRKAA